MDSEYSEESYLPKFWSRAGLDSSLRSEWQALSFIRMVQY